MSLYQSPIRPYDPVIQDVAGGFRYLRDNFSHTGQDSHTRPPAQDQSLWQGLTNIMPISKGSLERRWGYTPFNQGLLANTKRLFSYQRDSDGLRLLVVTGGASLQALDETGNLYNPAIYTPTQTNPVRVITSRSYAYIFNGYSQDLKKWNGAASDGVSNIGINVNSTTSGSVFGPSAPVTVVDLADHAHSWTNPNNVKVLDGSLATCAVPAGAAFGTNTLQVKNFGLATTGSSVTGIQVDVWVSVNQSTSFTAQLVKNNGAGTSATYANSKTITGPNGTLQKFTFGGASDTWGGIWSTGDTQSNLFGVNFSASSPSAGFVSSVTMTHSGDYFTTAVPTVTFSAPPAGTTATGTAVMRLLAPRQPGPGGFYAEYDVSSVHLTNPGSGYTLPPAITFTGGRNNDLSSPSSDQATATAGITLGTSLTVNIDFVQITVYTIPSAGVVVGSPIAGDVNLTIGRVYYQAFKNSITGHYSDICPASASTGPASSKQFPLTLSVNNDPQVDTNVILATADGGDPSILYLVAEIPAAATAYTDDTPELQLTNGQVLVFTDDFGSQIGIVDNAPPPVAGSLALKHQGRLWLANGQNVFFSKSVSDLTLPNGFIAGKYEEAWPAENYLDISEGAETVSALLSDGTNLYIGTQNHVRVLIGNDPTNFTEPTIVHPNVGVLNQEVWQLVFLEGAPAGAIWLTPDFRVIGSDFNTYYDIGTPVQNILNAVAPGAAQLCHAMLVSDGEFDLYILAVPLSSNTVCDTHLVYDMRAKRWFVWIPTDPSSGMLFNTTTNGIPQWLFLSGTNILQYTGNVYTDNGALITATAITSFLHLGEPAARKVLDDIEVIADPAATVTLNGASGLGHFDNPITLVTNAPLVQSPFHQLKVYLATLPCRYRYYQIKFASTSDQAEFLSGYSIRYTPFHTL